MRPMKLLTGVMLLLSLSLSAQETPLTIEIKEETVQQETTQANNSVETLPTQMSEQHKEQTIATQPSSIEALIKRVQTAPDTEKRVLMNQLKTQLKSMNKESRHQAMMRLKASFSKHSDKAVESNIERHQQHEHHEVSQHGNHQPKFRHLHLGVQDGSGPHRGEGEGRK